MNFNIQPHGVTLTSASESYVHYKLGAALRNSRDYLVHADVYLKDVNGPKGGRDKSVVISVKLRSRMHVTATAVHDDLYVAIGIACGRVKRGVKRAVRRQAGFGRNTVRQLNHAERAYHTAALARP